MAACWKDGPVFDKRKWALHDVEHETVYEFPSCEVMCMALNQRLTHLPMAGKWTPKLIYSITNCRIKKDVLEGVVDRIWFNKL